MKRSPEHRKMILTVIDIDVVFSALTVMCYERLASVLWKTSSRPPYEEERREQISQKA
jgi:hypothetical protein